MGVSTLHASNIKGFAFEFVRAHPVLLLMSDSLSLVWGHSVHFAKFPMLELRVVVGSAECFNTEAWPPQLPDLTVLAFAINSSNNGWGEEDQVYSQISLMVICLTVG